MARQVHNRDIRATLIAARNWIDTCLIGDGSLFSTDTLWTVANVEHVVRAFVDHPDEGNDDFLTKLKGQMTPATVEARRLVAEMLWALLLFPSNMKAATKRQQIREMWSLGGASLPESQPLLSDDILKGIGSGGPGFNNYRPNELEYLIALTTDLKGRSSTERNAIFGEYDDFIAWIDAVPRRGDRQYRHMLRFFAFPELVERISSNNDRRKILEGLGVASARETKEWSDAQLDKAILQLRQSLAVRYPSEIIDFYSPVLKPQWSGDQRVRTADGEVTVIVPSGDDEEDELPIDGTLPGQEVDLRPSFQIQARLAEIGAKMGFRIWLPRGDRGRVRDLISEPDRIALLEELPLNNEQATLSTIEQIDVIWLRGRAIVRAFEVEHTTSVYSGLLRMADLLALQPNLAIQLHIVAPAERRDKVFREMRRPVFSLMNGRPLSSTCTFISYESVIAIRSIEHLAHLNDSIIGEYEEEAEEG
ncbi:hypothetical protein [Bradyrhizobium sp. SUTN9-2]|uniref:hypothetical protein n=1 Tax=Bradyrhizobium sp. SUTN9-2 TaxID=1167456 RepID=UPI0011B258E1|nr:hypothetical protein [Bradyrhizobium sp. SUTN9-2]